jgi:thiol-disulfide isomerase/thioredoxin
MPTPPDDDDLVVRHPDEAQEPPEPGGRKILRWGREIAIGLAGFVVLWLFVGWVRAPSLDVAPAFRLPTLAGEQVSLADFRGRTVVLNFWATWCGPCKMELPTLVAFSAAHPDVPVLFVAVDGTPEALAAFAAAHDMPPGQVLLADPATRAAYGVSTLPTTVVVGGDGEVRSAHSGIVVGPQLAWMTR